LETIQEYYGEITNSDITPTQFFSVLSLVQLIEKLFPGGEPLHPTVTPAIAMATRLIATYRIGCIRSCARMTLFCSIMIGLVEESKR